MKNKITEAQSHLINSNIPFSDIELVDGYCDEQNISAKEAKQIAKTEYRDESVGIYNMDCLVGLKTLEDNSIDLCATDPPYFIDGMDNNWDKEKLEKKSSKAGVIGSMPVGMKFDPQQGVKFQAFMEEVGAEMFRVIKPGGFCLVFSQARLYHRAAIALENVGFEIRDMAGWTYEGQAKAFSMDHFVRKMKVSQEEKDAILASLKGRKTPQLKPMIEPIVIAQKPREGTFIENWLKHGVGLIDTTVEWNGKFPGNIINCKKPTSKEKGEFNCHFTVKPIELMKHLIKIFSKEGDFVLDPFLGSGTTAVVAKMTGRKAIGFEMAPEYFEICKKRVKST